MQYLQCGVMSLYTCVPSCAVIENGNSGKHKLEEQTNYRFLLACVITKFKRS